MKHAKWVVLAVALVMAFMPMSLVGSPRLATAAPSGALEPPSWELEVLAGGLDHIQPRIDQGRIVWPVRAGEGQGQILLYDVSSRETTVVVSATEPLSDPVISGDHLVYLGLDGTNPELFLLSLSSGLTTQLSSNTLIDCLPSLQGGTVVWEEVAADWSTGTIRLYDIASGKTSILFATLSPYYMRDYLLSESWVVWPVREHQGTHVWAYSAATGQRKQLSELEGAELQCLDGSHLLYSTKVNGLWELRKLDLDSGAGALIATSPDEFQSAQSDEGRVAWASWGRDGPYVVVEDVAYGTSARIPTPAYTAGGLVLAGDLLVWRGAPRTAADYGPANYLFAYNLVDGTATRITSSSFATTEWNTDGETLAIVGYPDLGDELVLVIARPSTTGGLMFTDVMGIDPYHTAIEGLAKKGIVCGYPLLGGAAEFRPNMPVTRAQFAKILSLSLDLPVSEDLVAPFVDLGPDGEGLYPHDYVAALWAEGIIKGTSAGYFSPYVPLSRAQLVTLVVRAAERFRPQALLPYEAVCCEYATLGLFDPIHGPTMCWAEQSALLNGVVGFGPGWGPWTAASRAEAAQVLWNLASF